MNPSVSLPTKNLIISSYYLKQQKTYPFIKVPPRMVSSGAEEGGINVSLLPLTKETFSSPQLHLPFLNKSNALFPHKKLP